MTLLDYGILALVSALFAAALYKTIKNKRSPKACGNCACSACAACPRHTPNP